MMKYRGKILFTIDIEHPDFDYVEGWEEDKVYYFIDVYTFNNELTEESIIDFIKYDLMLVAGGGYNTDHIHNVKFEIEKI